MHEGEKQKTLSQLELVIHRFRNLLIVFSLMNLPITVETEKQAKCCRFHRNCKLQVTQHRSYWPKPPAFQQNLLSHVKETQFMNSKSFTVAGVQNKIAEFMNFYPKYLELGDSKSSRPPNHQYEAASSIQPCRFLKIPKIH